MFCQGLLCNCPLVHNSLPLKGAIEHCSLFWKSSVQGIQFMILFFISLSIIILLYFSKYLFFYSILRVRDVRVKDHYKWYQSYFFGKKVEDLFFFSFYKCCKGKEGHDIQINSCNFL